MTPRDDTDEKKEPSKLHFWGGVLTGGASIPFSFLTSGKSAAWSGIKGAVIGGLLGLNGLFDDDEDPTSEET